MRLANRAGQCYWTPEVFSSKKHGNINMNVIRTIVFASPGMVPLEVGCTKGFFKDRDISVTVEATTSSVGMMTRLIEGDCDMAATAIDNVIAYAEGQGAAPTRRAPDLIAFMGYPSYRLPFVVRPDIKGWGDLKGKTIAVDALSTGFAFLLRQMLADNGLAEEDYVFEPVGAPRERWEALSAGTCAGTILTGQFVAVAQKKGFHVLVSEPDPWEDYQGAVWTARRDWAQNNAALLQRFIRAFLAAAAWTLAPANLAELVEIVRRCLPQLDEERVRAMAQQLQGPDSIIAPDMPIRIAGVRKVLALRSRYGRPQKKLDDPFKYIELSYYRSATPPRTRTG